MASVHIDLFARLAVYCCNSHTAQLMKLKPICPYRQQRTSEMNVGKCVDIDGFLKLDHK